MASKKGDTNNNSSILLPSCHLKEAKKIYGNKIGNFTKVCLVQFCGSYENLVYIKTAR